MTIHYIRPEFFMDANSYVLVGTESTMLIDTGTGLKLGQLLSSLERILNGRKLDIIVATHRHHDHSGCVGRLKAKFGAEAYMSEKDAVPVREGDTNSTLAGPFGAKIEPTDIKTVKEGDEFDLGGHVLRIMETPGHTIGSICLYDLSTGALFTGDTVSFNGIKRLDTPTASPEQLTRSLERLSGLDIRGIYPGHGDPAPQSGRNRILNNLKILELLYSDEIL